MKYKKMTYLLLIIRAAECTYPLLSTITLYEDFPTIEWRNPWRARTLAGVCCWRRLSLPVWISSIYLSHPVAAIFVTLFLLNLNDLFHRAGRQKVLWWLVTWPLFWRACPKAPSSRPAVFGTAAWPASPR